SVDDGVRRRSVDRDLRELHESLQSIEFRWTLAVDVDHDRKSRQRLRGTIERDAKIVDVRQRIAAADRNRMERRARRRAPNLARQRVSSVHRRGFRLRGEAHEELAATEPNPLRLQSRWYARAGRRRLRRPATAGPRVRPRVPPSESVTGSRTVTPARHCQTHDALAQLRECDSRGCRGLWNETGLRHPGKRVCLQTINPPVFRHAKIDTSVPAKLERSERHARFLLNACALRARQIRRESFIGHSWRVLALVIVNLVLWNDFA